MGQNITCVDMVTTTEKVEEGQVAVIEIDSPHGSPLTYDVDMGDGNTVSVIIPKGKDGALDTGGSGEVDGMVTTAATPSGGQEARRKRSVAMVTNATESPDEEEEVTTISFVPRDDAENLEELEQGAFKNMAGPHHKNDKMIIKYKYSKPGRYSAKVRVHNPFNEADSWLCPDIVVVPKTRVEPICSQFAVDITAESSLPRPLVLPRSEALIVLTVPEIQCAIDSSFIMPDFTWKTTRKPNPEVSDEEWRTEVEVCATQLASPNFTIPRNSLWYGTYKLSVTLGLSVKDTLSGRKKRETQNEVDLTGYTSLVYFKHNFFSYKLFVVSSKVTF